MGGAPMTQVDRLVAYVRAHPGATAMQLVTELAMPKYTSRVSDARDRGINIVCLRGDDGLNHYFVLDPLARPAPLAGTQLGAFR